MCVGVGYYSTIKGLRAYIEGEKSLVSENVQSNRCSLISFFFNFYKKNFIRKILNIAIMTPNVSIRNDIFSLGYFIHMHIIYIVSSKWLNSLRR